jgi:hypothetical protein
MPADEEVFKLREVEKRHKLEQREAVKRMHVHEKTTFASRMGTSLASEAVANVGFVNPCQLLLPFFFNMRFYPLFWLSGCNVSLNDPSRSSRTRRRPLPVGWAPGSPRRPWPIFVLTINSSSVCFHFFLSFHPLPWGLF